MGFSFGFSQFTQNAVMALLFWSGAKINASLDIPGGENVFLATFALLFGAFSAG
jgi:hypothetical protein